MKKFLKQYIHSIQVLLATMPRWSKVAAFFLLALMFVGALGALLELNLKYSEQIPTSGGSLDMGIVGIPRYVNPVLASTDTDKDMAALVFAGLMRRTSTTTYEPDLAQSYTVSEDGTTYTFILRDKIRFHDGKSLTATDVATTIRAIQNPALRSPWALTWAGVTVDTPDTKTVILKLEKPYSGFLYATTVGIIPDHLYGDLSPNEFLSTTHNIHPVGTGPYKVTGVDSRKELITGYSLKRFMKGSYPPPFLSKIEVKLYQNQTTLLNGLRNGDIKSAYSYGIISKSANIPNDLAEIHALQPRLFSLFLNPTHAKVLSDVSVRQAIAQAIDKEFIVDGILQGTVHAEQDIVPDAIETTPRATKIIFDKDAAAALLDKSGWKVNTSTGIREKGTGNGKQTLSLTLATVDTDDLVKTAHAISDTLKQIGIEANVAVYQLGDLDRDIIRPRSYDLLLFGQVLKQPTDLYAFWHSSQRKDPGLNISEYADRQSDALLETMLKAGATDASLATLSARIEDSRLVIPLYSPLSDIVVPKNIKNVVLPPLASPSDRLGLIGTWYRYTDRIFTSLVR